MSLLSFIDVPMYSDLRFGIFHLTTGSGDRSVLVVFCVWMAVFLEKAPNFSSAVKKL